MTEPEKFKLGGVLWGLVIPLIIGIVIVLIPAVLRPALDSWFPPPTMENPNGSPYAFLTVIFTHGFALMIVLGVPLFLGLNWNKWAGGAAGFVTGTLYYIAYAGYNIQFSIINYGSSPTYNLYADPSFIGGYIVGGVLIGYIAGALNNKSMRFKRMLGAGLTAALTVGIFTFILNYTVSGAKWMTQGDPGFALFTTMLPMIILGIIVPIIAKISTGSELWHP
ncbi:hypothetical protein MUO79_08780 [Candidatus Bathyarchaeota archaeon]|nr:hypothetical protein [Candidatus Bathyarchaeota archaeon]